jgi:hypothetical protein
MNVLLYVFERTLLNFYRGNAVVIFLGHAQKIISNRRSTISRRVRNVNIQANDPVFVFSLYRKRNYLYISYSVPTHSIQPMKSGPVNIPMPQRRASLKGGVFVEHLPHENALA